MFDKSLLVCSVKVVFIELGKVTREKDVTYNRKGVSVKI